MTAMTRSAAGPDHVATPEMAAYYAARAHAGVGFILTESTAVCPEGDGFPRMPRLHTGEQAASWRLVTDAVHAAGAPIFSQLLHCGRITHEDYTDGQQPVSSTDRQAGGINRRNQKPYALPRRLRAEELPRLIDVFRRAAVGALSAGFDGIELHLAHGYLADQFFDARINDRTDRYGGSIENRCRFGIEMIRSILAECGPARVMVRISPSRWMGGPYDWPDLDEMIAFLIPALDDAGLRLLDVSCARADYHATSGRVVRMIRPRWRHFLMAGASLSKQDAQAELDAGLLDMVTYGRFLIANTDLVTRFRRGAPLREYHESMLETLV
jgi:2,4-dienoyl-CoA reductase-like NADH-dependent reductase (Old Yellow Enzyme family)